MNQIRKQRLIERKKADKERDKLLNSADQPETTKKARISVEDEMIMKRQEHEMKMDVARLELEQRRETRLEEEGKRQDDFNLLQLQMQQSLLNLAYKMVEKQQF